MKIIAIVISLLLAIITNGYAQMNKNSIFLGGNFNFTTQNRTNKTQTTEYSAVGYNATIEFGGGIFLSPKLAVGLQFGVGRGVSEFTNTNYVTQVSSTNRVDGNSFSFTPILRYYHFLGEKFALIAQTSLGYQTGNLQNLDATDAHRVSAAFTPCIAYFVSQRSSFELMTTLVNANYSTYNGSSATKNSGFAFNLWNGTGSFAVAYRYYIRK